MALSKGTYTYLSVITMKTKDGVFYQARLTSSLGRKTIGLGSNELQALNIALVIDEDIKRQVDNGSEVDLDALKALAEREKGKLKAKKSNIRIVEKDDLLSLWSSYTQRHIALGAWSETYIQSHIALIRRLLESCPYTKLEEKQELIDWIFSDTARTPRTSKDRLKLIVAAIDWNSRQRIIPRSWGIEYRDALNSLSMKQKKKVAYLDDDEQIDIFSVKEVYQILAAIKDETFSRFKGKHKQYYAYAYFLWLTGCRPSEAIALKWENVDLVKKRIKICQIELYLGGQTIKRNSTKTVEYRFFPIGEEMEALLTSLNTSKGYVFVNALGKPISHPAFYSMWKFILNALGLPYRVPYQLRHTMISYHANNDYPLHKLAELVGNSEEVITEHYLRLDIERISLPGIIRP